MTASRRAERAADEARAYAARLIRILLNHKHAIGMTTAGIRISGNQVGIQLSGTAALERLLVVVDGSPYSPNPENTLASAELSAATRDGQTTEQYVSPMRTASLPLAVWGKDMPRVTTRLWVLDELTKSGRWGGPHDAVIVTVELDAFINILRSVIPGAP